ncbi:MAG: hypothetical protein BRD55_02510 [Bacteroidetes bacterium SW_9_63_38]|nr:MAG: hypothetical protein BRD55_02510 [Bacteroidetes bacterium SW_9_63_38]
MGSLHPPRRDSLSGLLAVEGIVPLHLSSPFRYAIVQPFPRGIFLSLLLAVFGLVLVGCDSGGGSSGGGGGGGDLTSTDARTQLQNTDTDFAADVNALRR